MTVTVHLQPRVGRPTTAQEYAVELLRSRFESYRDHVRRLGVRFDEVINADGEVDKVCRVHVTLVDVYDVPAFVVEGRAEHEREATHLAVDAAFEAVGRAIAEATSLSSRRRRRAS